MSETIHITAPLSEAATRNLRAGDMVLLHGEVVLCAGLTTHQRILQYMAEHRALPIALEGSALLHIGSYSEETAAGFAIRYINPTTSTRFNEEMPAIIRGQRLRAVGGKGGLDSRSVAAMQEVGCVYLSFLGGGSPLLSQAIREVRTVEWGDLVPHYRLVKVRVEALGPAVVGIDSHGASLYENLKSTAQARLPEIMQGLDVRRSAPEA